MCSPRTKASLVSERLCVGGADAEQASAEVLRSYDSIGQRLLAHRLKALSMRSTCCSTGRTERRNSIKAEAWCRIILFGRCAAWRDARSVSRRLMTGSPVDQDAERGDKVLARWNGHA
jgi:hypothetical protein